MNTRLILQLSLFGIAMAIASAFWIPSNVEPIIWLIIFIICAYIIAKKCEGNYFLNGFLVSIINSVWVTSAHIIFFRPYLLNHPQQAEMIAKSTFHESPRLMMLMTGPVIGVLSGLVLGLFALLASKLVRKV
jgi:hypothetical protein